MLAFTTVYFVALLLTLGTLVSMLRDFCQEYLLPDHPKYQGRILQHQEQISRRIEFYTAAIRRPSFHDGAARPR